MTEVGTKQILKEEMAIALDNLKVKGKVMSKEALEEIALEISDALGRVAKRTPNMTDDFFLMIKPMLDEQIDKIDGEKDL